ncbi:tripartite motif-containing protein 2-like [Hydractinia symbiolongicarpus]|uniref:tripartite motif-containing protein 2-like n=1 Tax=Hydractinia symbiolongicarpus TaxID=13093 RepID=UPI002550DC56|nr:tripartite motif-containing protein 2-like [Hydractinia symbiolongicarpus]
MQSVMNTSQLNLLALECNICLDAYLNPKYLNCGHTYCQQCLDDILQFQEDGSAELHCPLKCERKTMIGRHETSSCLPTNFGLVEVMDEVSKEKGFAGGIMDASCQQSKICNRPVSLLCITCGGKMCRDCELLHACKKKSLTTVTFNEKTDEIQPVCQSHNTFAKSVCLDCDNAFTCTYCVHREHKNHSKKTIDEFGFETKQWFQSFITSFLDAKVVLENLKRKYNEAVIYLNSQREVYVRELKERKLLLVEQFIQLVNIEEKNLLQKFDDKLKEFQENMNITGYKYENNFKNGVRYTNTFNTKSHFEIIAEKKEIERQLQDLPSMPSTVPFFALNMPPLNDLDMVTNVFGTIKISVDDAITASFTNSNKSVCESKIAETDIQCDQLEMKHNLMSLFDCVYENEKSKNDINAEPKAESIAEARNTPQVENVYTFEELDEMIEHGDIDQLQSILMSDPNIVKMKGGSCGGTLLIQAACYHKPLIVQDLIDAGSDVYAMDDYHWNAFHHSVFYGYQNILQILINVNNTQISNVNCNNETPLHFASAFGFAECVKTLLSSPYMDVNIRNENNKTAYQLAGNKDIKRLLKKHKKGIPL